MNYFRYFDAIERQRALKLRAGGDHPFVVKILIDRSQVDWLRRTVVARPDAHIVQVALRGDDQVEVVVACADQELADRLRDAW